MNLCPYLSVTKKTCTLAYYRYQSILSMTVVMLSPDKTGRVGYVKLKKGSVFRRGFCKAPGVKASCASVASTKNRQSW